MPSTTADDASLAPNRLPSSGGSNDAFESESSAVPLRGDLAALCYHTCFVVCKTTLQTVDNNLSVCVDEIKAGLDISPDLKDEIILGHFADNWLAPRFKLIVASETRERKLPRVKTVEEWASRVEISVYEWCAGGEPSQRRQLWDQTTEDE